MYTTSSILLKSLADNGITHIFVNWGSDHPALLEDLQRQRKEGDGKTEPQIITCPNEMVALSAAQGFTQATGRPAAVIVHVDVGTQALAGAVHNVDRGRAPVLIYAGASPFSRLGEMKGSRNEWILSVQDVPDQPSIVRQYMRYTAQIPSGKVAAQVVNRALQIATSHPKGPVYLWARRETTEEEIDAALFNSGPSPRKWPAIEPTALSTAAAGTIATASPSSQSTSNRHLAHWPIPVIATCASAVAVPFSHPFFLGTTFLNGRTHTSRLAEADVIIVLDSDVPWIEGIQPPNEHARVFVIDSGDPLKTISSVGQWHVDAALICNADAALALSAIIAIVESSNISVDMIQQRAAELIASHKEWVHSLDVLEDTWPNGVPGDVRATLPNFLGVLRRTIAQLVPSGGLDKTLVVNEGITNYPLVWDHMRTEAPGMHITSGGSSLGWGLAAAIGASLGGRENYELIVGIIGDGSYLFGVPSSAFWIARRYQTPFLTIVINNGGWKAPKLSMLGCHLTGHGSLASSGVELSVGFGPDVPDYSQIAVAASAGWVWGKRIGTGEHGRNLQTEIDTAMAEAVRVVLEEKRCAVLDCVLDSF
ncbi:hypothetical protein MIND_00365700 [Mycena indigotica]|uniref:Uncharacterized protein n=1 Tax=Mycena indigotica TaxID=2126181 RepID=A0A8H6WCN8_9AGAR|nr:uncharacterized protein MIND_00365700 [Mycena indigotica]KAF7309933.1 hypothetical protein MIND_00365700 [Mycena indigotica]